MRTARAKGLPPRRVIGLHALRNALIPVVTVIGLQTGTLLAGAVLTETIFSWPGVGKWLVESIGRRDYPALQGGILLISSVVILVNVGVDLLYGLINPRFAMPADTAIATQPVRLAPPGPLLAFWHSFREHRGAVVGLAVISLIVFMAIFAPLIAPHNPLEQFRGFTKLPPIWVEGSDSRFILGTDAVGRDMLSRLIYGARVSLFIGLSVMIASTIVGVALGLIAAWFGGMIDVVILRIMDLIMSIPSLVLAILIIAIIGPTSPIRSSRSPLSVFPRWSGWRAPRP